MAGIPSLQAAQGSMERLHALEVSEPSVTEFIALRNHWVEQLQRVHAAKDRLQAAERKEATLFHSLQVLRGKLSPEAKRVLEGA